MLVCEQGEAIVSEELSCLVKLPEGKRLSAKITELTGITEEMLEARGMAQQDAANTFVDMVKRSVPGRILFVAYNANFDVSFLNAFLSKNGCDDFTGHFDVLDTLTVLKDRKPYPHKLSDAIAYYDLDGYAKNSHRALGDAEALYAILNEMAEEEGDLPKYINLIGYNPRYGVEGKPVSGETRYVPQRYNSPKKLYEEI